MRIIGIIFLLICFNGFSQNEISGKITYSANFSFNENINASNSVNEIFNETIERLKDLSFELVFNKYESVFKVAKQLSQDYDNYYVKSAIGIAGKGVYYSNFIDKEKLIYKDFLGDEFLIEVPFNDYNWIITKDTKIISGYTCYKATMEIKETDIHPSGIKIVAWFTNELPAPFGPKGYGGLPGLILELNENNLSFLVSQITLSKAKVIPERPSKGISMTLNEYNSYVLKKVKEYGFEKN